MLRFAGGLDTLGWLCRYHHSLKTRGLYDLWRDEQGTWHWEPTRVRVSGT